MSFNKRVSLRAALVSHCILENEHTLGLQGGDFMITCDFRIKRTKETCSVAPLREKSKGRLTSPFHHMSCVEVGNLILFFLTSFISTDLIVFVLLILLFKLCLFYTLSGFCVQYVYDFIVSGRWDRPSSSPMGAIAGACKLVWLWISDLKKPSTLQQEPKTVASSHITLSSKTVTDHPQTKRGCRRLAANPWPSSPHFTSWPHLLSNVFHESCVSITSIYRHLSMCQQFWVQKDYLTLIYS